MCNDELRHISRRIEAEAKDWLNFGVYIHITVVNAVDILWQKKMIDDELAQKIFDAYISTSFRKRSLDLFGSSCLTLTYDHLPLRYRETVKSLLKGVRHDLLDDIPQICRSLAIDHIKASPRSLRGDGHLGMENVLEVIGYSLQCVYNRIPEKRDELKPFIVEVLKMDRRWC